MYVCVCVCMCVYMCVYVYKCVYVSVYVFVCVAMHGEERYLNVYLCLFVLLFFNCGRTSDSLINIIVSMHFCITSISSYNQGS